MMASYDRAALDAQLISDEGLKLRLYRDIMGKESIGVGRNLTDVGISQSEAMFLLNNDIARAELLLDANAAWWRSLDPVRQAVLLNMCFNMGWGDGTKGLSGFRNMLAQTEAHNFDAAARAMQSSSWAIQVPSRALRLSRAMVAGSLIIGG
jgi:lysozyme